MLWQHGWPFPRMPWNLLPRHNAGVHSPCTQAHTWRFQLWKIACKAFVWLGVVGCEMTDDKEKSYLYIHFGLNGVVSQVITLCRPNVWSRHNANGYFLWQIVFLFHPCIVIIWFPHQWHCSDQNGNLTIIQTADMASLRMQSFLNETQPEVT